MNKNKSFCCKEIRLFRGDYLEPGNIEHPISGAGVHSHFESCEISFCPLCGVSFADFYYDKLQKEVNYSNYKPKSNNPSLCCSVMESRINTDERGDWFQVFYQPWTRRFFFSTLAYSRQSDPEGTIYKEWDFYYCMDCGTKLPKPLLNEWLEIVQKEFGVEKQLPLERMLPLVPEEFRTEQWWRKRGL